MIQDYYTNPHHIRALEEQLVKVSADRNQIKNQLNNLASAKDNEINRLNSLIQSIDEYDKNVLIMISADERLSEAWNAFRVLYQLIASKELLETAKEKTQNQKDNICHGCGRQR